MGDISIIARRLTDGHVQYGWSGNGEYFRNVGLRLLAWYDDPEKIEYLFGLGELTVIGKPESENGGFEWYNTNKPTGYPILWAQRKEKYSVKLCLLTMATFTIPTGDGIM